MEEYQVGETQSPGMVPEQAAVIIRWLQNPASDIPEEQKNKYITLLSSMGKSLRMAVLFPAELDYYSMLFDKICLCMKMGLDDYAEETIASGIRELSLTASIGGKQLELGFMGGQSKQTQYERVIAQERKSRWSRLGNAFGKKEQTQQEERY